MKRLPIIPTLVVAAAVAIMVGLGIWQLQRAEWKDRLLLDLEAAKVFPPIDLDPLILTLPEAPPVAFRPALVTCSVRDAEPELRASRNIAGQSGYGLFVPCRPGASGWAGRLEVNAGWTARPDAAPRITLEGVTAGRIGSVESDEPIILTAANPSLSMQAAAPARVEDIPNNHLMYAFQWFFFAATAALIYLLALRRRRKV